MSPPARTSTRPRTEADRWPHPRWPPAAPTAAARALRRPRGCPAPAAPPPALGWTARWQPRLPQHTRPASVVQTWAARSTGRNGRRGRGAPPHSPAIRRRPAPAPTGSTTEGRTAAGRRLCGAQPPAGCRWTRRRRTAKQRHWRRRCRPQPRRMPHPARTAQRQSRAFDRPSTAAAARRPGSWVPVALRRRPPCRWA
eukprot:scaffold10828_cov143-Isochrysis_galbana.AAC.7